LAGKFAGIYFIAGLSCQQQKALEPEKYNIGKPPRGYWAKLAAGKISNNEAEGMKRAALAEAQL
jgi:hypothetical protein